MIKIPISASISGGTAPYTFTFSSSNTCVSFGRASATASVSNGTYYATTDVIYPDETCIEESLIYITFVDANGCSKVKLLTVENPCTLTNSISTNGEFVFVATTTGGSPNYTYQWTYNTDLWEKAAGDTSDTDNYLSLKLKSSSTPTSTPITCVVTDSNGCTEYASYAYSFCKPTLLPVTMTLSCQGTSTCTGSVTSYANFDLTRHVTPCSNQVIDWTKLQFSGLSDVCIINNGDGTITVGSTTNVASTKIINWAVTTTNGIVSEFNTMTISIVACVGKTSFSATPSIIQLTIADVIGTDKLLPVEPRVGGTPNWATFAFVGSPTWGTVTLNGNREIVYDITNVATTPTIPDTISWTMQDYSGNQVNITDTVLRNRIALPVTTTEQICTTCGETFGPFDLTANDTGSIDKSTVEIVLNDADIVITKGTDNNFTFTVLPGVTGFSNLNSYKVANIQGAYAANQNFIVHTACAGISSNMDLTCEVAKTLDLADRFTNTLGLNLLFTETTTVAPTYITQGGVITNPTSTGSLNFASIATNRTYTFQLSAENTAACPGLPDLGTVEIFHGTTPHLTIGTPTLVGTIITVPYTYSGLVFPVTTTLNGVAASYKVSPVQSSGSGTFSIYGTSGLQTILVSCPTICGNIVSDSDASITI